MHSDLLAEVYQKYHKEIYRYLYALCGDSALAEDLLQEVFLKAILSLSDSHTNIRAWLYLVARNLFLNNVKKGKRIVYEEISEEFADVHPGPEEKAMEDMKNQELYRAIMQLDTGLREVIALRYFSELSQKEIASLLHISPENVRVKVYRAKKEIKNYMEGKGYDL
ncbi:MAG: RNA polymerase sigma factor [Lachnospiraceae bacterium]|nr:RNA polymerase sigma factor [Lachnospiraceae bacterium]